MYQYFCPLLIFIASSHYSDPVGSPAANTKLFLVPAPVYLNSSCNTPQKLQCPALECPLTFFHTFLLNVHHPDISRSQLQCRRQAAAGTQKFKYKLQCESQHPTYCSFFRKKRIYFGEKGRRRQTGARKIKGNKKRKRDVQMTVTEADLFITHQVIS